MIWQSKTKWSSNRPRASVNKIWPPPAWELNIRKYSNRKNKSKCFTAYCFDWNFTLLVLSNLEAVSEAVILGMIPRAILRDCVRPSERSLWNVWWYFLELYCLPPRRRNRRRKILNKFYEISAFLNRWVPKGPHVEVFHLTKINSLIPSIDCSVIISCISLISFSSVSLISC